MRVDLAVEDGRWSAMVVSSGAAAPHRPHNDLTGQDAEDPRTEGQVVVLPLGAPAGSPGPACGWPISTVS
jgi:hypothetical protein